MTQEQKNLLIKDLCARLPYGVKIQTAYIDAKTLEGIQFPDYIGISDGYYSLDDMECKPYLFPLSSMTEEQYYEMMSYSSEDCLDHMKILKSLRECTDFTHWPLYEYRVIDWYNKNHFDYRGLIPMGLAINATGLNIY